MLLTLLSFTKHTFKSKHKNGIFLTKIDIAELCKGVHCVDLGESFQTHIYLQNLASIQPRTSPVKFARSSGTAARGAHHGRRARSPVRPVPAQLRSGAAAAVRAVSKCWQILVRFRLWRHGFLQVSMHFVPAQLSKGAGCVGTLKSE